MRHSYVMLNIFLLFRHLEKYSSGWRGAPAKGVGRSRGARVQIPPSPFYNAEIKKEKYKKVLDKWLSAVINFKSSLRTRDCQAKCSTGKDTSERMMPEKKLRKSLKSCWQAQKLVINYQSCCWGRNGSRKTERTLITEQWNTSSKVLKVNSKRSKDPLKQ